MQFVVSIFIFFFCFYVSVKSRTIALKTTPHLPKLSIKLELKPEHHNPAFYENSNVTHNAAEILADDDDGDECDEYDEDSNSLLSNQSSGLQNDLLTAVNATNNLTTISSTSSSLLVNPAAAAAVAASNNDKVRKSSKSTVKKTQSPAPPIATRKATSYIGVSGSYTP